MTRSEYKEERNVVVVNKAEEGDFFKEYVNNGVLQASQSAQILFEEQGNIEKVLVANGDYVKKGQLLGRVEDQQQQYNYDRSVRNLEKARLEMATMLIEQGYKLADSNNIPNEVYERAKVKSGYYDAINDQELASIKLAHTRLVAPFNGVIADLEAKANNQTSQYKQFCQLINNAAFEVEFLVLESELEDMEPGMTVEVSPFAYPEYSCSGEIHTVNPKVEESGMVKVRAIVKNMDGKLAEGMNVKILVKKLIGKRVFVPKEAITLRQERDVVFTHRNDTAFWNYVRVGPTNSKYTVIEEGIRSGDEVVVEGNFNLAHLAVVEVID